ncbi:(2Fe-2S)-binding protein [Falsiroseomonas sp.]|uniref:(2Fe-2S)-binding protein n=1 Tax=Falsiroseomonas sp. TaxID=2870721 RepID=UPI003F716ADA
MDVIAKHDRMKDVAHPLRIAGISRPADVTFSFEGQTLSAPAGENLAAALIASGIRRLGEGQEAARPRAALCMMGVCQQCLLRVDGRLAQACLMPVRDGMVVTAA